MDQLVKEQSQKLIAKQMRQARVQRQIQVRQQALAWTEATRKKFDETKEREIKRLADTVTEEAQNTAIQNIQYLTRQNDLAMAEIGMAHRAAAGFHNVEKLKSLKRLKDEEAAKHRGVSAITKQKNENMSKSVISLAILKRKEAVRKAEDQKSKELISRKPLMATNANSDARLKPAVNLGPPEYEPSLAKTLRTAPEKDSQSSAQKGSRKSSDAKSKVAVSSSSNAKSKVTVSSSSDMVLKSKPKPEAVKQGVLTKMARIKTIEDPRLGGVAEQAKINDRLRKGLGLRKNYSEDNQTSTSAATKPEKTFVRYFDVSVPKGEVKYVAPEGLVVKESSNSPDAWEKGKETLQKLHDDEMKKTRKEEEISRKASERGKQALKRARLEKELQQVQNDLLQEVDHQFMGNGSQTAILGLDDDVDANSLMLNNQDLSSDDFSAVETDEEFEFPQPTMKTFAIGEDKSDKHIMLVPVSDSLSNKSFDPLEESQSLDSYGSYSPPSMHHIRSDEQRRIPTKDEQKRISIKDEQRRIPIKDEKKFSLTPLEPNLSPATVNTDDSEEEIYHSPFQKDETENLRRTESGNKPILQKIAESASSRGSRKSTNVKDTVNEKVPSTITGTNIDVQEENVYPHSPSEKGEKVKQRRTGNKPVAQKKAESISLRTKDEVTGVDDKAKKQSGPNSSSSSSPTTSSSNGDGEEAYQHSPFEKDREKDIRRASDKSILQGIADSISSIKSGDMARVDNSTKISASLSSLTSSSGRRSSSGSGSKSSSSSTVAEIKIKATTGEPVTVDRTSLENLHTKAKQQEKMLRESPPSTAPDKSNLKSIQTNKVRRSSNVTSVSKNSKRPDMGSKVTASTVENERSNISSSRTSDDDSVLVKLTVKESTQTTPVTSDRSSVSTSTDYYSPPDDPEGPFTSTPDGKLHPKPALNSSNIHHNISTPSMKRLALYHYVDKFLARRPESIEALPVTTSSSSEIRADSDVLSSESFESLREKSSSMSHSTSSEAKSSPHSSNNVAWRNMTLPTVSEEGSELESGSTIAEAAVVANLGETGFDTKNTTNSDSKSNSGSRSNSTDSTSDSLTGMLKTLSRHQAYEKQILNKEDSSASPSGGETDSVLSYSQALGIENLSGTVGIRGSEDYNRTESSRSSGSLPDASLILRELRSRHRQVSNSSKTSGSTPKSGPEKETKRVELLSDVTPIKLWETPPRQHVSSETEQLSAVFDKLIDKWSNIKIEPPPWCAE